MQNQSPHLPSLGAAQIFGNTNGGSNGCTFFSARFDYYWAYNSINPFTCGSAHNPETTAWSPYTDSLYGVTQIYSFTIMLETVKVPNHEDIMLHYTQDWSTTLATQWTNQDMFDLYENYTIGTANPNSAHNGILLYNKTTGKYTDGTQSLYRRFKGTFDPTVTYGATYDTVLYAGTYYQSVTATNYKGTWSVSTTYAVSDAVNYSGAYYVAIKSGSGQVPSTGPAYWSQYTPLLTAYWTVYKPPYTLAANGYSDIYIGYHEPFRTVAFGIAGGLTGGTASFEYWNGSGWMPISSGTVLGGSQTIVDGTNTLTQSGTYSFYPPQDWARREMPSLTSCSTWATTTSNYVCPADTGYSWPKYWIHIGLPAGAGGLQLNGISGDTWLASSSNAACTVSPTQGTCNMRGWAPKDPNRLNIGLGNLEFNPTPPANASAQFRYQSRVAPYFGKPNRVLNNSSVISSITGNTDEAESDYAKYASAKKALPYSTELSNGADFNATAYDNVQGEPTDTRVFAPLFDPRSSDYVCSCQMAAGSCTESCGAFVAGNHYKGAYSSTTTYAVGDVVIYNAAYYAAIQSGSGHAPGANTYWTPNENPGEHYKYLSMLNLRSMLKQTWPNITFNGNVNAYSEVRTPFDMTGYESGWDPMQVVGFPFALYDSLTDYVVQNPNHGFVSANAGSNYYTGWIDSKGNNHVWDLGERASMIVMATELIGQPWDYTLHRPLAAITYHSFGNGYGTNSEVVAANEIPPTTLTTPVTHSTSTTVPVEIDVASDTGWKGWGFPYYANVTHLRLCPPAPLTCSDGDTIAVQGTAGSKKYFTTSAAYPTFTTPSPIARDYPAGSVVQVMTTHYQGDYMKGGSFSSTTLSWRDVTLWADFFSAMTRDLGQPAGARVGGYGYGQSPASHPPYLRGTDISPLCSGGTCTCTINSARNADHGDVWMRLYTKGAALVRNYNQTSGSAPLTCDNELDTYASINLTSLDPSCAPNCSWYRLHSDNTTEGPITSVMLRAPEGAVLLNQLAGALSTSSVTPPAAMVGVSYSSMLQASGGSGTGYTWQLTSGSLDGLNLAPDGTISGTPSSAGTFSFAVKVTDSLNDTATASLSMVAIPILAITTTSLPRGMVGTVYAATLTASGGTMPYTWSLASGALPPGISLSQGGSLTGTPTVSGQFSFSIRVTDAGSYAVSQPLMLTVAQPIAGVPYFTPPAGNYSGPVSVTISTSTAGATICYTTDGSVPTATGNLCAGGSTQTYSGPITVPWSEVVSTIAIKSGYQNSAVGSASYILPVQQPKTHIIM